MDRRVRRDEEEIKETVAGYNWNYLSAVDKFRGFVHPTNSKPFIISSRRVRNRTIGRGNETSAVTAAAACGNVYPIEGGSRLGWWATYVAHRWMDSQHVPVLKSEWWVIDLYLRATSGGWKSKFLNQIEQVEHRMAMKSSSTLTSFSSSATAAFLR